MKNKTKVIIVISCIFFLYCIFLFIKLLANPTDTFIVEKGKIYKEESQEGYIIRDEQIIENDEADITDYIYKNISCFYCCQ